MKKTIPIFVFLFLSSLSMAQFNMVTHAFGQTLDTSDPTGRQVFTVHFNSTNPAASWIFNTETQTYTITQRKRQTQRGLQVNVYGDAVTTGNGIISPDFECRDYGGNRNPHHVASLDSLLSVLRVFELMGTTTNSRLRPAACLFHVDNDANNQAFGAYPAHYKRVEYGFRYNFAGRTVTDDIQFDIQTYALGNTGKSATYKLEVYTGSVSAANLIGEVANIYTTGEAKKTIRVAQAIGLTPAAFTNRAIFFFLKTMGTTNESGIADAVPNAEGIMDPFVVIDNMSVAFLNPIWRQPVGAITNAVFNHNNGNPQFIAVSSTDFSGGTPVNVIAGSDQPIRIYLSSENRVGTLTVTEANSGGVKATAYSVMETGALKLKDGSGQFTIDIPYTRTLHATSNIFTVTVAAPISAVNEEMELTIMANVPLQATRTVRLEINNGVRFWYNVSATGVSDVNTRLDETNLETNLKVVDRRIVMLNAQPITKVYTLTGQLVRTADQHTASQGIPVPSGVYIVTSGSIRAKVLVP